MTKTTSTLFNKRIEKWIRFKELKFLKKSDTKSCMQIFVENVHKSKQKNSSSFLCLIPATEFYGRHNQAELLEKSRSSNTCTVQTLLITFCFRIKFVYEITINFSNF